MADLITSFKPLLYNLVIKSSISQNIIYSLRTVNYRYLLMSSSCFSFFLFLFSPFPLFLWSQYISWIPRSKDNTRTSMSNKFGMERYLCPSLNKNVDTPQNQMQNQTNFSFHICHCLNMGRWWTDYLNWFQSIQKVPLYLECQHNTCVMLEWQVILLCNVSSVFRKLDVCYAFHEIC